MKILQTPFPIFYVLYFIKLIAKFVIDYLLSL